jgi:hypothetical protein
MTLEISPVLAGVYDAPDYTPTNNFASTQLNETTSVDSRRYTQFDRSAAETGSMTDFSFGDFLDLINPLQHIPVVSSVYRTLTDEHINPVSRIVGDTLYGAALGGVSALAGAVGAIGDAVLEAQTGNDSTGNVVAALMGTDTPSSSEAPAQVAETTNTAPPTMSAATQSQPALSPTLASVSSGDTSGNKTTNASMSLAAKTYPLDPKKLPYGGVIDPAALQGQNMATALAAKAPGLQMGHMIYTGTMAGVHASPMAAAPSMQGSKTSQVSQNSQSSTQSSSAMSTSSAPAAVEQTPFPNFIQDILSLKAVSQYKSTASQSVPTGTNVDVLN